MTAAEEKSLVGRAKKGELTAFETLVTAYERRVYALALRSSGNEEDARDIAQEVFLRVYRSLDSFRGDSGFSTWIYRITMNICVDFARRNVSAPGSLTDEDDAERPLPDPCEAHQPEHAAENAALREELRAALAALSEDHRQIVLLRDVSGLSYDEIARTLELSEGTVKSRLARARRSLREILIRRGNICVPAASKDTERGTLS